MRRLLTILAIGSLAAGLQAQEYKGFKDPEKDTKRYDALKQKKQVDIAPEEDKDFVKARELFWSGSYDQAEVLFLNYLKKNPDHETTRKFLQMIQEAKHYDPERAQMIQKALEEVRFKRIEWKELTLDQAIAYLRDETRRQLPSGENVNFVNLVPASEKPRKITLKAEDATLKQIIEEMSNTAGIFHYVASDGIVFEKKAEEI